MVLMIDGDGALRHFPEAGPLREQPARDIEIYNIARNRWVERMNEKIRSGK
jgi:hypothetical protein